MHQSGDRRWSAIPGRSGTMSFRRPVAIGQNPPGLPGPPESLSARQRPSHTSVELRPELNPPVKEDATSKKMSGFRGKPVLPKSGRQRSSWQLVDVQQNCRILEAGRDSAPTPTTSGQYYHGAHARDAGALHPVTRAAGP